jgi:hypothetical protein
MATPEQVAAVRVRVNEPDAEAPYTDEFIEQIIDDEGDVDMAAAAVWRYKASTFAEMVDISEAGSSRKNSQLMKNALDMAQFYGSKDAEELAERPITRPIVRA